MTYNEFKNTYTWMLKKYYQIANTFGCNLNVNCIIENYVKVGRRWILETTSQENNISNEYYYNVVDSIPFFKNLGGIEKIEVKATKYGYIPFKITSISPDKMKKTIRVFTF